LANPNTKDYNDVTGWSGSPQPDADRKDAYKSLPELRRLLAEGKYNEAEKFANSHFNRTCM
jgi:alpha-L-fucosidase 2